MAMTGCEPVDDGAATRVKGWDGVLTDNVLPTDRDVFTDTDETMKVADGCAKTELDAMKILEDQCASCHDAASPDQDPTTFDFVLNVGRMKTAMWTPTGGSPMRYIDVGKPEASAIFLRVGIERDMPPRDGLPVTLSGVSVMHYWIGTCL
ncbi:MAG TPA: hypothetical protein VFH68_14290 [Polyangia bacterium]|nr:hypothetical protein [Polyangia bacterium]